MKTVTHALRCLYRGDSVNSFVHRPICPLCIAHGLVDLIQVIPRALAAGIP